MHGWFESSETGNAEVFRGVKMFDRGTVVWKRQETVFINKDDCCFYQNILFLLLGRDNVTFFLKQTVLPFVELFSCNFRYTNPRVQPQILLPVSLGRPAG